MAKEIERKYLVDKSRWKKAKPKCGKLYRQGYIPTAKGSTVRVRTIDNKKALITVKGPKSGQYGLTRSEFEYKIPLEDAVEILNELCGNVVCKTRYKIEIDDVVWEVDEFHEDNKGLIIAEIELESEHQYFDRPSWINEEVSHESRYSSAALSRVPYNNWYEESNEN